MPSRTLVVGLGNPILSDDRIGWQVEEVLRQQIADSPQAAAIDILHACTGGLALAELMTGYDRVIVVDAIVTGQTLPGTVSHFILTELPGTLNSSSSHDTSLRLALQMLRACGAHVPRESAVEFVAVEAQDVWTFGEACTPAVGQSICAAAAVVARLLCIPSHIQQKSSGEV